MQKIKTDFGFKTVSIGSITIYTGKIRIKSRAEFLENKLQNFVECLRINEIVSPKNYTCYTTISFETTNIILNQQLIAAINNVLCEMMHKRIDAKYSKNVEHLTCVEDYLPF